jgi:hypothetical protein
VQRLTIVVVCLQIKVQLSKTLRQGCFCLPFDCGTVRGCNFGKSAFFKIVDVTASLSRMEDETESGP